MDGWIDGWMDASGWMDGWMHACMYVCMYGPVSRVPESVSLGDHTIGGGQGSGVRTHIYITITIIIIRIKVIVVTIMHCITFINYTLHCVMLHYIKFPHSIASLLI